MKTAMKFVKITPEIYVAETVVSYTDVYGNARTVQKTFRVDGRPGFTRSGKYRVDVSGSFNLWYEAIDDGVGFASVKAAKAFTAKYAGEIVAQKTLTPHVPNLQPLLRRSR